MAGKKNKGGMKMPSWMTKQSDGSEKSSGSEQPVAAAGANKRKTSPVLHETVFETVAGVCRKNKLFVVKRDGEDLYVAIYLNLDDIGGLSAKSKDEAKGSMVSQINAGHISVMFNSELEAQNGLIFIPNATTVEHMMEYTLLREDRNYNLVLIDSQGEGDFEKTEVQVSLEFLKKCHDKKINIKTKLGDYLEDVLPDGHADLGNYGVAQANKMPVNDPVMDIPMDDGDDEEGNWQPIPDGMEEPDFEGEDAVGEPDFSGMDGLGDEDGSDYQQQYGDGYEGDPDAPGFGDGDDDDDDGEEEEEEIDYSISRQAVARKFFNEDLTVELDTAALDQALASHAEFRPIDYRKDGSWMSDVLNPLIAHANQELFNLHRDNLGDVQTEYLNQLEQAYLQQMQKMSAESVVHDLAEMQASYDAQKKKIPDMVAEKTKIATEAWEKSVKEAGESARVSAEQAYRMKFKATFDDEVKGIGLALQAELDAEFTSTRSRYLNDLKAKLLRDLDVFNSQLIQKCVESYRAKMPEEQAALKAHMEIIQDELSSQRDAEIARIRVLDDQLKRDTRVAEVTSEYDARIVAVTTEFESRISALQADMEVQQTKHLSEMTEKNQTIQEMQTKHTQERDEWNSRINELLVKAREADEAKAREVDTRIAEMRAERDSYCNKYEHLQKTQKHGNMLMLGICIVSIIAALCVGLLIGNNMGKDKNRDDIAPPPAVSDVQNPGESGDAQVTELVENPGGETQGENPGGTEEPVVQPDPQPVEPVDPDVPNWEELQDPPLDLS